MSAWNQAHLRAAAGCSCKPFHRTYSTNQGGVNTATSQTDKSAQQVGLLLAQDAAPSVGSSGSFDAERIARVSLHGLQLVMLLALLVLEVRAARGAREGGGDGVEG